MLTSDTGTLMTAAKTYKSLEPEHALWAINRTAALAGAALMWRLVFWPGLEFWAELPNLLWLLMQGGMYSDAMKTLMLTSLFHFGLLVTTITVMCLAGSRMRHGFDAHKAARSAGRRPPILAFPGPTIWQARLNTIDMQRRFTAPPAARGFAAT